MNQSHRIELIDLLRGLALIAMTLFHFGWDLEMFGFADPGFASQPAMVWFARCIASSFLVLVGYSLVLAHTPKIRWPVFWKRMAMVAGAALLITIATFFATPGVFIFFGILHHIALASLFGLLFLRAPAWLTGLATLAVLAIFANGRTDFFDAPIWWWTGLNATLPRSTDYVPIFPFFAAVLAGMTIAKCMDNAGGNSKLATFRWSQPPARLLKFIGRHSLIYYLAHQPVMIALLWLVGLVL